MGRNPKKIRTWMYKLIDGQIISKIFEASEKDLEDLKKDGWVDTPVSLKKHVPERDDKGHFVGKKEEDKGKKK